MATTKSRGDLASLAAFAARLDLASVPARIVTLIKHVLLDSLGCAFVADGLEPECARVEEAMRGPEGPCTLLSTGVGASPAAAAFINGALVHALNYDPVGEVSGHIGVACVAAPLAQAEASDASGRDLLRAAIIAAEVSARVTRAIHEAGRRPNEMFLAGQLLSGFGAAAGAARLIGVDDAGMESTLCLALMQASGSRQVIFGAAPPAKSIYGAFPAQAGVMAAMLAKAGVDARCDLFGPPAGFFPAFYGAAIDTAPIARGLFDAWACADAAFKPWPASAHVIPFIEAAIEARREFSVDEIESVTLVGAPSIAPWLEPLAEKLAPENVAVAANSAPWCVAVSLVAGKFDPRFVDPNGVATPDVRAIASKLRVDCKSPLEGASLKLRCRDGREETFALSRPLGHPENPMSEARLLRKFEDCCALGRNRAARDNRRALADALLTLETAPSVREIMRLLRSAT